MNLGCAWFYFVFILLGFFPGCNCLQKASSLYPDLTYKISFATYEEKSSLAVTLDFDISNFGMWELLIPHHWANQETLFNAIKDLHVTVNNKKLFACKTIDTVKEGVLTSFDGKKGDHVTITYHVVGLVEKIDKLTHYQQTIFSNYFHVIGHGLFVLPAWSDTTSDSTVFKLFLNWDKIQPLGIVANSFGFNQQTQIISDMTISKMRHSVYAGGDFRPVKITCAGKPVYVVLHTIVPMGDEELSAYIEKIITTQRNFCEDYEFAYFLITVMPFQDSGISGSGMTNAFCMWVGNCANNAKDRILFLLGHEHFHTWNGHTIKFGGKKNSDKPFYWFREGFTDYYAYVLNLRAKIITKEEYLKNYNLVLQTYFTSPVRNISNQEITNSFWKNYAVEKLPYQRGFLLAHNWNAIIKRKSDGKYSIDDVMRKLLKTVKRDKCLFSVECLCGIVKQFVHYDIQPDVDRFIENGETIIPEEDSLGNEFELNWQVAENLKSESTLGEFVSEVKVPQFKNKY